MKKLSNDRVALGVICLTAALLLCLFLRGI